MRKFVLLITSLILFVGQSYSTPPGNNSDSTEPEEKNVYVNTDENLDEIVATAISLCRENKYKEGLPMLTDLLKRKDIGNYSYILKENGDLFIGMKELAKNLLINIPNKDKVNLITEHNASGAAYLKKYNENKDIKYLFTILDECFLSEQLDTAIGILASKRIEEGSPNHAIYLLTRLSDVYKKELSASNTMYLLIAYSMVNNKVSIEKVIKEIPQKNMDEKINVFGGEKTLKDFVEMIKKGELEFPKNDDSKDQGKPVLVKDLKWQKQMHPLVRGEMFGIDKRLKGYPQFHKDTLITNQALELIGYNIKDGNTEVEKISLIEDAETKSFSYPTSIRTAAIKNGIAYASLINGYKPFNTAGLLGKKEPQKGSGFPILTNNLIAYDLNGKKIKWSLHEANKDDEKAYEFLSNTIILSQPTIVDEMLYVETLTRTFFPSSYIVAINLENGKFVWKTLVSSKNAIVATAGLRVRGYMIPVLRGNVGMLRKDRYLYFSHAYGVMGALDADSGDVIWLRRFDPIQKVDSSKLGGMDRLMVRRSKGEGNIISRDEPGWIPNTSIMLDENTVLFAPQKCSDLYVLNRHTGQVVLKVTYGKKTSIQILGVYNGKILAYDHSIFELDWKKGKIEEWGFYGKAAGKASMIGDYLYLPLKSNKLVVLSIPERKSVQTIDVEEDLLGNVVFKNNQIVMMGLKKISVWDTNSLTPDAVKTEYKEYVNDPNLDATENMARKLINDLGSPDFNTRVKAFRTLKTKVLPYKDYLKSSEKQQNPEVRAVIEHLLQFIPPEKKPDSEKKTGPMGPMGTMIPIEQ